MILCPKQTFLCWYELLPFVTTILRCHNKSLGGAVPTFLQFVVQEYTSMKFHRKYLLLNTKKIVWKWHFSRLQWVNWDDYGACLYWMYMYCIVVCHQVICLLPTVFCCSSLLYFFIFWAFICLGKVWANERRRYLCNVFSHWLSPCSCGLTHYMKTHPGDDHFKQLFPPPKWKTFLLYFHEI